MPEEICKICLPIQPQCSDTEHEQRHHPAQALVPELVHAALRRHRPGDGTRRSLQLDLRRLWISS